MNNSLLREKLQSKIVSPRVLLSNSKFLNEQVKNTIAFSDPLNLPFYYHLGKQSMAEKVLQIGAKDTSAYIGPCFLQSCRSVHDWIVLDETIDSWTAGFVRSNLKNQMSPESDAVVLVGDREYWSMKLRKLNWDMAIVASSCVKDRFSQYLELAWENLNEEGLLVVDYISEKCPATAPDLHGAFERFCRVKNRKPDIYETRYGVGIVKR